MPGLKIVYAHTTAAMTTATAAVLALNDDREYALFVNDSAVDVYLKIGVAAVANQGIRINANARAASQAATVIMNTTSICPPKSS